jgi:ATP-dependent DNA ligase
MRLPYRRQRDCSSHSTSGTLERPARASTTGLTLASGRRASALEGVVAKRLDQPRQPGQRAWIEKKKSGWPPYEAERAAVIRAKSRGRKPERLEVALVGWWPRGA